MEIARMIEEKQEKEKNLIEIRMVEKMVPRKFYKYLKMFEKKELERMLMRKTWDSVINLRKEFVLKKKKIYLLSRIVDITGVLYTEEEWKEEDGILSISKQLDN